MNSKICKYCHLDKPLEAFTKDKYYKLGFKHKCKECTALDQKVARLYAKARKAAAAGETLFLVSSK
jgi:hypothetical protein